MIRLINPTYTLENQAPVLSSESIDLIETISKDLPHKHLKGHLATTIEETKTLSPEEIDIARSVLLLNNFSLEKIRSIESCLDILALQVLARLKENPTTFEKIEAINELLFFELGIRFPPESEGGEKTKSFSDVSTILFSRRGICLGASVTYLCLAQRLNLPLLIYTPPGHIFLAVEEEGKTRTIETTARGVHIPLEEYYGLTLKYLPKRSMKEVIGMVLFNNAASFLHEKKYAEACKLYEQASFFEDSDELYTLLSLSYLLTDKGQKSQEVAVKERCRFRDHLFEKDILLDDLAEGRISKNGAEALILHTKDDEASIREEIEDLQQCQGTSPSSRAIPFHLAHAYLSLGKTKDALVLLENISSQEETKGSLHVLLASIYQERFLYDRAWKSMEKATAVYALSNGVPLSFVDFAIELHQAAPNPDVVKTILKIEEDSL